MRILIFGDSIGQGAWGENGGWVALLTGHYSAIKNKDLGRHVDFPVNLSIDGDCTRLLLARIRHDLESRHDKSSKVIVALGVNDSRLHDEQPFMDISEYRSNLAKILEVISEYSDKVIFIGLTPCNELKTTPVARSTTVYLNKRIMLFEDALAEFCKEQQVEFLPLFEDFGKAQAKEDMLPDGIHPNDKGHQLIANKVIPALEKII